MSYPMCQSSELKTSDTNDLSGGPCMVHAVTLIPAAADSELELHDAATVTGTSKIKITGKANTGSTHVTFDAPVVFNTSCSANITGASAGYIVFFSKT